MDELRLEGVHDDGEHLVLSDAEGRRSLLAVDQHLRQAVQRARRMPARRQRQGAAFGPRDIQSRFRSGATVDEIVEESGWEPERVRRYEWPILAERGHMAREAQKVELGTRRTEGYRSAFEGAPLTLSQTLQTRAPQLGIAAGSFDWDAWQRPDLLWTVAVRFRVVDPGKAPQELVDQQAQAQWVFNPANLSVTPEPGWAQHLTEDQQPEQPLDGVFGQPHSPRAAAAEAAAAPAERVGSRSEGRGTDRDGAAEAAGKTQPDGSPSERSTTETSRTDRTTAEASRPGGTAGRIEPQDDSRSTEELLEVLEARRGQRLGADETSDDQLAAILGRSMGHVDSRARPISAPDDAQLFQQPIQPGTVPTPGAQRTSGSGDEVSASPQADAGQDGSTPQQEQDRPTETAEAQGGGASQDGAAAEPAAQESEHEATIHHLGRADAGAQHHSDIVEITDDDEDEQPQQSPAAATQRSRQQDSDSADRASGDSAQDSASGEEAEGASGDGATTGKPAADADRRPRPKGRVGGSKRTRSSVPSWDDIVFGAKND